jgi:hypothetical protein
MLTTKMDDTFVGTHDPPLVAKDLAATIVRLGDIFDGENQKCSKDILLAPQVEKKGLGILRRKRPPPELGVRGPFPITTQSLENQGIVIETAEISDLALEKSEEKWHGKIEREEEKSVGESFALLPEDTSYKKPSETIDVVSGVITDAILEVVTETIEDLISSTDIIKSVSAYADENATAYVTANASAYADENASANTDENASAYVDDNATA